jgi:hypothetical protein
MNGHGQVWKREVDRPYPLSGDRFKTPSNTTGAFGPVADEVPVARLTREPFPRASFHRQSPLRFNLIISTKKRHLPGIGILVIRELSESELTPNPSCFGRSTHAPRVFRPFRAHFEDPWHHLC